MEKWINRALVTPTTGPLTESLQHWFGLQQIGQLRGFKILWCYIYFTEIPPNFLACFMDFMLDFLGEFCSSGDSIAG